MEGGMGRIDLEACYSLVYILGWIVIGIGAAMILKASLYGGSDEMGLSVIFGGLFMTTFVRNAQLKAKVFELERRLENR